MIVPVINTRSGIVTFGFDQSHLNVANTPDGGNIYHLNVSLYDAKEIQNFLNTSLDPAIRTNRDIRMKFLKAELAQLQELQDREDAARGQEVRPRGAEATPPNAEGDSGE